VRMGLGRASLIAAVEIVDATLRRLVLWIARLSGSAVRITSRGWLPVLRAVVLVALLLLVLPPAINALLDLAGAFGVWDRLEIEPAPSVGNWWSWERVLGVAAVLLTLRWLVRARERVIVEEFVDYTSKDATAVSGLAMLLVTELSRLRELYGRVNDELSTPLSVGAGPGGPRETSAGEPGSFLSVRADEVTEVLSGAVASESKLSFAGFTIPIGVVLSLLGRVARGPRVIGSVHFTEAGGGPTVTAQIVGRGTNFTWRIDAAQCRRGAVENAFLEPMVTEIACRMFTDMTLRGSVRWQAIQAFTEYLQLYWESLRTPKNRATFLKQAEGKLLEAVAEDETFDLAFYNLGVVYSQLAQAEFQAAATAEYPRRKSGDPDGAHAARTMAARAAFARAIQLNRGRWEAIYALAVHDFSTFKYELWKSGQADDERLQKEMRRIVCRCQRVLELDRWNAQAYDLMGMAQVELKDFDRAVLNHGYAVTRSWSRLCRAEYRERRKPPTTESVLPGARANAAGALHNLARARYFRVKDRGKVKRRLGVARADRIYHQALSLAPDMARAAMEFERGCMREQAEAKKAIDSYRAAVRVEPENPLYWAHLARAYARFSDQETEAIQSCEATMDELAPIYRRTLEPVCPARTRAARKDTLDAILSTYCLLRDWGKCNRVQALYALADRITEAEGRRPSPDVSALRAELDACAPGAWWEREQIGLALARSLGPSGDWPAAAAQYESLIKDLKDRRKPAIRQHALHAKHAKALRRAGEKQKALEAAAQGLLLDPISAVARRELGKAHFALLQYEEALDAWKHTLWLTPNDATLHWKAAFSLWSVAQDRQDPTARRDALLEAAAGFEQASMLFGIENATGWAWSRLWHGRVCQEMGEHDLAIRHLRAAKGCGATSLAARVLLAEVYECTGQSGLARDQFGKVQDRLRDAEEPLDLLSDDDWGATLSYREIAARLELGLGRHAFEVERDEATATRHAGDAERLARELTRQPRSQYRLSAQALELQSRVALAHEDLEQALEKIQRAAHLYPAPDILLRRIEIAAACARNSARVAARTQLVAGMADDLRSIYRTQGEGDDHAQMGRQLVRQWIPDEVVAGNGRPGT
jgi:tetratricopeptide (TPR) repeat protein